ncbi:MAG: hypothetical protein PHR83_16105 [Paludibacter sp.]|nr:hypothetical protein [Paludibacter sp.]
MAYNSKVYRILIASPSDVEEEREIISKVIQEWNDLHSYNKKVVLLPLRWETHSAPQMGMRPQEVINKEVVDYCDMAVGVFWTRIGSPTGEYQSGTIEEIERVGKAGKIVMLYFSNDKVDLESVDLEQYKKLKEFKTRSYPNGLIENYKSTLNFRDKFSKQLEIKLRQLISEEQNTDELNAFDNTPKLEVGFFDVDTKTKVSDNLKLSINVFEKESENQIKEKLKNSKSSNVKFEDFLKEFESYLITKSSKKISFYLKNTGPVGIRDIYIEFRIDKNEDLIVANSFLGFRSKKYYGFTNELLSKNSELLLEETDNEYIFHFSYVALQPQRLLNINDYLNVFSSKTTNITLKYRVFADCFSYPISDQKTIILETNQKKIDSKEFIDKYKDDNTSSIKTWIM